MLQSFTAADFRRIVGCFSTGIAIVLVASPETPLGMTVNSFTSVSLDPPLVLFCLDKKASLLNELTLEAPFSISFLAADQEPLSRYFADQIGGELADDAFLLEGVHVFI